MVNQTLLQLNSDRPKITLRDYQLECLDAIKSSFEKGVNRQAVVLPTGSGKSQIFAHLLQKLGQRRMFVLAHREELLEQAKDKIETANPDLRVEIEQANRVASQYADVVVASVPTIGREGSPRLNKFNPSDWPVIICDEMHHSISKSYLTVFKHFKVFDDPSRLLVGFTATPKRGDNIGLEKVYQDIVYNKNIREMIDSGYLCQINAYRKRTTTDISEVRTSCGDFVESALSETVNTPARNQLAVDAYEEYCKGRRTLIFCVDCDHAEAMADTFKAHGVDCGVVLGETPKDVRALTLANFSAGSLEVLSNCMVLTEGWDEPQLSAIIMARPTKSGLLYTQAIGRGTRLAPGKENLVIVDLTDNSRKHKLISLPVLFGLAAGFDLKGKSVTRTVQHIEELSRKRPEAAIQEAQSLEDVESIIESFDIFAGCKIDDRVKELSRFNWIKYQDNGYYLPLKDDKRLIVVENLLGKWDVLGKNKREEKPLGVCPDLAAAFRKADGLLLEYFPDQTVLHAQDAHWQDVRASDKQRELLKKLGVPNIPNELTKGQASILISQKLIK